MSTRSYIGIELPDGKVKSIYVHSDGYISGVGKTLVDNYNTFATAIKLFAFGDCSSLGDTLEDRSFYSRDWNREEENNQATTYNNEYLFYNSFKFLSSIFYTPQKVVLPLPNLYRPLHLQHLGLLIQHRSP